MPPAMSIAVTIARLLIGLVWPWPSSGATRYFTGFPLSRTATTIWLLSRSPSVPSRSRFRMQRESSNHEDRLWQILARSE